MARLKEEMKLQSSHEFGCYQESVIVYAPCSAPASVCRFLIIHPFAFVGREL